MQKVVPSGASGRLWVGRYDIEESVKELSIGELLDVISQGDELCDDIDYEVIKRIGIWVLAAVKRCFRGVEVGGSEWFVEYKNYEAVVSNIVLIGHVRVATLVGQDSGIELSIDHAYGGNLFCNVRVNLANLDRAVFGKRDFFLDRTDLSGYPAVELAKVRAHSMDLCLEGEFELQRRLKKFLTKAFDIDSGVISNIVGVSDISILDGNIVLKDLSMEEAEPFTRLFYSGSVRIFDGDNVVVCIPVEYFEEVINS